MSEQAFEAKSYPEMWKELGMDVVRFEKMRCLLGEEYCPCGSSLCCPKAACNGS